MYHLVNSSRAVRGNYGGKWTSRLHAKCPLMALSGHRLVRTYNRNARAPVMTDVKVTCVCGAIYEVIETKGPSREARPFKCVLCDRELFAWDGDNVGQLHLVWRPDEDRE